MSWDVNIDAGRRLVLCRLYGTVTLGDAIAARDSIPGSPTFDPDFDHLIDFSGVTEWRLDARDMRELAKATDPFSQQSRRVIVAPSDLSFGMARMYDSLGHEQHQNEVVVRTLAQAEDILSRRLA